MADPRPNMRLKMAILQAGLTQRLTAFKADLAEQRLSGISRGYVTASPDEQKRLARVLKVPVAELFPEEQEAAR